MPPFYFLTFAKVSVSVSKKKKVLVSVSKTFGLKKKSRYRSRKHLVSKKSLGIGLENIWSRKKFRSRSRKFWSQKKVSVSVSMKFFGLVTQCSRGSIRQFRYWQTRAHCTLSSPGRPHGSDSRHKTISITKNNLNCKKTQYQTK